MKLRFHARGDALVTVPGIQPSIGQPLLRVGRVASIDAVPPASREPFEVDSESPSGQRLKKLIRREPCLWAADEATAAECGVEFKELKFESGSWIPEGDE